uniref:Secreted protein n=2 Tax=Mesocestoides corti TaxID=53468 RepID=A0A5K3G898_MESCO
SKLCCACRGTCKSPPHFTRLFHCTSATSTHLPAFFAPLFGVIIYGSGLLAQICHVVSYAQGLSRTPHGMPFFLLGNTKSMHRLSTLLFVAVKRTIRPSVDRFSRARVSE